MNPRYLATQIIHAVCYQGVSLSDAFDATRLPDNERAFIKEMCFGTLRFWIRLQAILKSLLEKPLKKSDKDIECLLCIGLYQLLYMQIPEYAAVDETVTATRVLQKSWASKLVNKILRMTIDKKNNDTINPKGITAEFSHPNWIIEKLQAAYPDAWEKILIANNQKAPLFLRINTTKITRDQFESALKKQQIAFESVVDCPQGLLLPNALPVEKIPGFFEGWFSVQDASGQRVVDLLDLQPGQVILDACAAPGSKTTHILERNPGIKKLIAIDISKSRLQKIHENIKRLQLNAKTCELIAADVMNTKQWHNSESFDRILIDAPCSATGVIRRHPDIKLLRKKTDIPVLAKTQLDMLNKLWTLLKTGGKCVYTTCSIFPDENKTVIDLFLSEKKNEAKLIYSEQVITGDCDRDGFYYAVIEKMS